MIDNQQRFLGNAQPLARAYRVQVVYKGESKATLSGDDLDELKARAYRLATSQGWHRAVVEVMQ